MVQSQRNSDSLGVNTKFGIGSHYANASSVRFSLLNLYHLVALNDF